MRYPRLFAVLTLMTVAVTGAAVAAHLLLTEKGYTGASTASSISADVTPGDISPSQSLLSASRSLLIAGVSPIVPEASRFPIVTAIPWDRQEVSRLYRSSGTDLTCQLLEPGVDVNQPLVAPTEGKASPLGRKSAFSITLQLDPRAKESMNRVTTGAVESYLSAHQLTIQPTFYHDDEGQLFFGSQVRAAFVDLSAPERSVQAEPMIGTAVGELKVLGAFWSNEDVLLKRSDIRTLILGFRYTLESSYSSTASGGSHKEYELIIFQLLDDATVNEPSLAVFATSDGRTRFHELDLAGAESKSLGQTPSVTATVRFGDSAMLGLYPSNPIVTGVGHRARMSLPATTVQSQLAGVGGGAPVAFPELLKQLHEAAGAESSDQTEKVTPADAEPVSAPRPEESAETLLTP